MHPMGKVKICWSPEFAYAIGLLTTDGNLSKDGRHISLVSKDLEQLEHFLYCLGLKDKIKIAFKNSGNGNMYPHVQLGDVLFYRFLMSIGLTPRKSKTIGSVSIPQEYFFDLL